MDRTVKIEGATATEPIFLCEVPVEVDGDPEASANLRGFYLEIYGKPDLSKVSEMITRFLDGQPLTFKGGRNV